MSWWELSDGSWLGDRPADTVGAALAQARSESLGDTVPAADLLATTVEAIRAVLRHPGTLEVDLGQESSERGTPVPALHQALVSGLEAASGQYRDEWGRDPTATELARLVVFCLEPDGADVVAPFPSGAPVAVRTSR